jgi:signal peptidase I
VTEPDGGAGETPPVGATPGTPAPDPVAATPLIGGAAAAPAAMAPGVEPADEPAEADVEEPRKKKHEGSFMRELPFLLLIAFVLALVIKAFFFQAFFIPSGSMEQTLHGCPGCKGDRVLVNKVVYKLRDIHRGEIVVFNGSGLPRWQPEVTVAKPRNAFEAARRKIGSVVGLGAPGERDFIKRVIGLPGDTVACCTNGNVTVNKVELHEPYLYENTGPFAFSEKVPPGQYFVMGDHRSRSSDSRYSGTIPKSKIIGRAFVVVWPPSRWKGLRVPGQIEDAHVPKASALGLVTTPPALGLAGAVPVTLLRRRRRRRR